MTVSIISDLHCRYDKFPHEFSPRDMKPADVLVVAGDLSVQNNYDVIRDKLIKETDGLFKSVVLLRGNHDYYHMDRAHAHGVKEEIRPTVSDNFVVTCESEGRKTDFICTTLWSPIRESGLVRQYMNDYNYIPGFTTERCTELFWENLGWLEATYRSSVSAGNSTVFVTHHLPRHELIDPFYQGDSLNEAFCVLDEFAERRLNALKPSAWIHGHSHNFLDTEIDGVRYVRNPYGYSWKKHVYENGESREKTGYVRDFTIEI